MASVHETQALSPTDTRRLERLALAAGITPKAMLHHVLRDGFAYTERFVKDVAAGLADADAGKTVTHAEARRRLDAHISAKHAVKPKQAA